MVATHTHTHRNWPVRNFGVHDWVEKPICREEMRAPCNYILADMREAVGEKASDVGTSVTSTSNRTCLCNYMPA